MIFPKIKINEIAEENNNNFSTINTTTFCNLVPINTQFYTSTIHTFKIESILKM